MLALLVWTWSDVAAQLPRIEDEGISLGPMQLYPSLSVDYARDSNIFYRSLELEERRIVSSGVFIVRPRLLFDLPIGAQGIRWSYAPLYRDYVSEDFSQSERISHFFDFEGAFRIGSSVRVNLRDHLVRATVELDQVDAGGELTFGLIPFVVHEPEVDVTVDLGARHGLSVIAGISSSEFDEGGVNFFGYRQKRLEGRYNYRVSEPTTLYAFYGGGRTAQRREQILFSDVDGRSRRFGLGVRRMANQRVVSELSLGHESLDFRGTQGMGFSGLVVDANATWSLSDVTRLHLGLERRAYQSFFVNNDHFVLQAARVRMARQVGRRALLEARVSLQSNRYADAIDISVTPVTPPEQDADPMDGLIDAFEPLQPSVGLIRKDRVFRGEVGAAYLFHPRMRVFLGYNHERRNSNITEIQFGEPVDPFHYRVDRLVFRVELGWL